MDSEGTNGQPRKEKVEVKDAESEKDEEEEEIIDAVEETGPDVIDLVQSRIDDMKRIPKTEAVEYMYLRWNLLTKIEDLNAVPNLRCLELYDNQITKIENLDCLTKLEMLDISVNRLTKIEGLDKLANLQKLFLCSNKIQKIENINHLKNLEEIELGDNKIRVIENLSGLDSLKKLYLGKNKIDKIKNLEGLNSLELLSLQSNRITKIENLDKLPQLLELHLSENGIIEIEGLENLMNLTILDLASNRISLIQNISHLEKLEEFWLDTNKISDWNTVDNLAALKNVNTVYLEHNPIAQTSAYRRKVRLILPWLENLDAIRVRHGSGALFRGDRSRSSLSIRAVRSATASKTSWKSVSKNSLGSAKDANDTKKGEATPRAAKTKTGSPKLDTGKSKDEKNKSDGVKLKERQKENSSTKSFFTFRGNKKTSPPKHERSKAKWSPKFKMEGDRLRREESKMDHMKTTAKKEAVHTGYSGQSGPSGFSGQSTSSRQLDNVRPKTINAAIEEAKMKLATSTSRIDCCLPKAEPSRNDLRWQWSKTKVKTEVLRPENNREKSDISVHRTGSTGASSHSDYRKITANELQDAPSPKIADSLHTYRVTQNYLSVLNTSETKVVRKVQARNQNKEGSPTVADRARPSFCTRLGMSRSSRTKLLGSLHSRCLLKNQFARPAHRKGNNETATEVEPVYKKRSADGSRDLDGIFRNGAIAAQKSPSVEFIWEGRASTSRCYRKKS